MSKLLRACERLAKKLVSTELISNSKRNKVYWGPSRGEMPTSAHRTFLSKFGVKKLKWVDPKKWGGSTKLTEDQVIQKLVSLGFKQKPKNKIGHNGTYVRDDSQIAWTVQDFVGPKNSPYKLVTVEVTKRAIRVYLLISDNAISK